MPLNSGLMLCGTAIALSGQANLLAEILSLAGLGGSRIAVDGTNSENAADGWGEKLFSCIANLDPFTVTIVFNTNFDWASALTAPPSTCTITLPVARGRSSGAEIEFLAGVTKFTAGGELQGRMTATVEITPSGEPDITPGTVST